MSLVTCPTSYAVTYLEWMRLNKVMQLNSYSMYPFERRLMTEHSWFLRWGHVTYYVPDMIVYITMQR